MGGCVTPFPEVTSISPLSPRLRVAAPTLTHIRRRRAKKVSSNRLTVSATPIRGLFTDGAHLLRRGFVGRHMDGQRSFARDSGIDRLSGLLSAGSLTL